MKLIVKPYGELSLDELYEILKVRSEVFVVEQNCPYLDPDGTDRTSIHFMLYEGEKMAAYLRIFEVSDRVWQIGRVLTVLRSQGYGGIILHEAMDYIRGKNLADRVVLEAQTYAVGFYEREGFRVCSDEFDEDGIPHVRMEVSL